MDNKTINLLLADDDQDDRAFFRQALLDLEISVNLNTVDDGDELMAWLLNDAKTLPDVLFLDINMPRKNGFECLTEIKSHIKLKDLTVIMFSTSDSREKINKVFKSGVNVYVHKPNDFEKLKQLIRHALPISVEKLSSGNDLKYILNA